MPTATLDSICEDLKAIRVLKLDVEGSEPGALRGGPATVGRTETAVVETAYQADLIQQLLTTSSFDVVSLRFARHVWARRVPEPRIQIRRVSTTQTVRARISTSSTGDQLTRYWRSYPSLYSGSVW